MSRRIFILVACVCAGACVLPGRAAASHTFTPGAPGLGDEYFPLDGNGGYDVKHYDLELAYAPATDTLTGVATIEATATQNLSRFNLDFDDLTVHAVHVDGRRARWTHAGGELTITPAKGLRKRTRFTGPRRVRRRPADAAGRLRASSTRTTARSRSVSRTGPRRGSRRTTT